jgi:oligopeptide transport system substrate-binding protein
MSTASDVVGRIEADGSLRPELITIGSACSYSVSFNTRRPPFDDAVVRLAFARALDRGAYIREILGGQGIAATGFIPRGFPGHDPDDTAQGFDPAAARRLLSSSKYAQSLPAVVLHYITDNRVQTARQRWLRDRWKVNLGVDVLLEPIESSDLVQLFRRVETIPHLNHLGWCADYPDQQDWLTLPFHSDRAKAGLTGPARTSGFADPEFDGLLRQADHERAAATRDDLYRQASRILTAKAVIAPLHYNVQKVLVKPWVKGIVHSALDVEIGSTSRYEGIYIARRKQ